MSRSSRVNAVTEPNLGARRSPSEVVDLRGPSAATAPEPEIRVVKTDDHVETTSETSPNADQQGMQSSGWTANIRGYEAPERYASESAENIVRIEEELTQLFDLVLVGRARRAAGPSIDDR